MASIEQAMIEILGELVRHKSEARVAEINRLGQETELELAQLESAMARIQQGIAMQRGRFASFAPAQQGRGQRVMPLNPQQGRLGNGGQHGEQTRTVEGEESHGRVQAGHAAQRIAAGAESQIAQAGGGNRHERG